MYRKCIGNVYEMSFLMFIYGIVKRDIIPSAFPDDFSDLPAQFLSHSKIIRIWKGREIEDPPPSAGGQRSAPRSRAGRGLTFPYRSGQAFIFTPGKNDWQAQRHYYLETRLHPITPPYRYTSRCSNDHRWRNNTHG